MKDIFLVDADDTILDFHTASGLALKSAFEEFGGGWKEEYAAEYRVINNGLWECLERKEITRTQLMETRFTVFLRHLQLYDADDKAFNRHYIQYLSTHPIYLDGAEAFLEALRKRGRVFIVTNGTSYIQKSRFDIAKLWEKVDGVFISETARADKPAKAYTDYVISHIERFERERAVWIGDSLSADIQAANDADITSIWFNLHGKPLRGQAIPTYTATNFQQALEIIKGL